MLNLKRKIVTDESMRPVAVLIDYEDWEKIEQLILKQENQSQPSSLEHYAGVLKLAEDPVAYQKRVREEWASQT